MVHIRSLFFEGPLTDVDDEAGRAKDRIGVGEVIWNITNKCNLLCKHCYIGACSKAETSELTDDETIDLADKIGRAGIPLLFITGGEPFERKNLFDILKATQRYGIRVILSTNAVLINREKALQLKSLGVDYVALSIYGPEKFHDEYVRRKGTFRKIVENIGIIRKNKIGLCIKTTVNSEIYPNLGFILDFARRYGARIIYPCDLITSGRASDLNSLRVSNDQWRIFADTLLEETLAEKNGLEFDIGAQPSLAVYIAEKLAGRNINIENAVKKLYRLNSCHVGRGIMGINAKGDFTPCNFIQDYSVGNFREISIEEAIRRLSELGKQKIGGCCGKCDYAELCRGCRAKALLANKDILAEDPSCLMKN